jgi:uncharacterized membrane protein HdeD (DUF308 family)
MTGGATKIADMWQREGQAGPVKRSGWLTFSAVVLIIAGIMRVIDAIWAFGYHGAIPDDLKDAILGHSLKTYGWIWLIAGVILIAAGVLVLGPGDRPSAEISRWIGIIAAALAAISAIFVMPYYPVWSLIYIAIAIMVIYGLSARYGEQAA